jgi:DNA-binding transcriptional ArsR family regulator
MHSYCVCMTNPEESGYVGLQLDATAIKVLAHPLRSQLLSRLRTGGPATATELADLLSTNTGATSYHLRKLESVGLVADTGEGTGKRRLWRAATDFHSWNRSSFRTDEDSATAVDWLDRFYLHQFARRAEEWLDASEAWPDDWVDAFGLNDTMVQVTPDELRELKGRIDALIEEFRGRGSDDPRARLVSFYYYSRPTENTPPPGGGS